jgi:hypothetical protein
MKDYEVINCKHITIEALHAYPRSHRSHCHLYLYNSSAMCLWLIRVCFIWSKLNLTRRYIFTLHFFNISI